MKDRLLTLLFALGAFVLSVLILVPPQSPEKKISVPTTEDNGAQGLKGLYQWLDSNKIRVMSLRKRFTDLLDNQEISETGNLLIISVPFQRQALDSEWLALHDWVARGNAVLVLAAGYNIPDWAENKACFCQIENLLSGFGWRIESESEKQLDNEDTEQTVSFKQTVDRFKRELETMRPKATVFQPLSEHALLSQVSTVSGMMTTALLGNRWIVETDDDNLGFRLLALPEQPEVTMMWQLETGAGQVILSLAPDLFNNQTLNKADNAVLLSNIIAQYLDNEGQVIFDDYHFGLSSLYDPEQFFGDIRLHKTLGFIFLLWLFYVFGYSQRLAPVHIKKQRPSTLDYVNAMAGFFSHRLDRKTLALELTRRLLHDVRQRWHLSSNQDAWAWLQQHGKLNNSSLTLLHKAAEKQAISLSLLIQTITQIRKQIFL